MQTLKDIARRMDCHPRTAKRWWRRLDWLQLLAGRPSVAPDVVGHGPHRWHDATADRLIELYENFFRSLGTTPQIYKQKFAGKPADTQQLSLFDYHASPKPSTIQVSQTPAKKARQRRPAAEQ